MLLTLKQVKEKFNISRITLLKWEKEGLINPAKTPKGTRRYSQSELEYLLHMNKDGTENDQKDLLLYARVSTRKQLQYLKNQEYRLQEYANSLGKSYVIVSEIASGVNENRRGLKKLLSLVKKGAVKKVVIESPERLARFGYEYLKFILDAYRVELVILQDKDQGVDIQHELAEDLVAIVTSFAGRIYGKRGGHKKKII